MAAKKQSLLDLSTTDEIDRKLFRIDDIFYEIRDLDELTLSQQQQMAYSGKFFDGYMSEDHEKADHEKASRLLDECLDLIVVKLPAKVRKDLKDRQKFLVFNAFSKANDLAVEARKGGE